MGCCLNLRIQNLRRALVEQVWAAVEEANSLVPEYARIAKELVVVADPKKPFPRASKGTIKVIDDTSI